MSRERYDVIVIGAGLGGSACAGLLAKRGLDVLLLEKNRVAGGKAMSLAKNGFRFTAWVVIGAPVRDNYYQRVLDELGVADLAELVVPGTQGSIYRNPAGRYSMLPDMPVGETDPNVIFAWLEIPEHRRPAALEFFAELTFMPSEKIASLEGRSFASWLDQYDLPLSLRAFLTSLCCDGMFMVPSDRLDAAEAIASLQEMFLKGGGVFCKGGFGRVAEAYCEAVRRFGGTVQMGTRVERILVESGKVAGVRTSDGRTYRAPVVVSNAGIQPTVLKYVGEEHFEPSYVDYVRSLVPSYALLGYRYFLSRPVTDRPYGVIFSDTSPWTSDRLERAARGQASREGVVYYEVPSNYDPEAAPPGKQILLTGSFCPPDPDLPREEIQAWADAGERILFDAFPELPAAIEDKDLYTTRSVANATRDSAMPGVGGETIGLAQVVGQAGTKRPRIESPLEGLYFTGADAGARGVGTQMAIASGIRAAEIVWERRRHGR
ncbi:MAG: NAD(P)/FAD-dependent oxidoreductase [Candidatus Dadabacteria bacterium]|nr:MAG: NAD(P)/FAD-dependent oxidoreductase [Candidatus Dadabacteria bacterium]